MLDQFSTIFSTALFSTILSLLASWVVLKIICFANQDFLSFLYISSGKSTTNARLLGGLAVSASMICVMTSILIFHPNSLSTMEYKYFTSALVSILLVTMYGYIDDKFEVRVRFKLIMQFTSVLGFAFLNAQNISPEHSFIAFGLSSVLGLALVNGTNLLDGLDTLSVKLGITSSLAFLYLGIIANSPATIYLSIVLISALTMFYFFNREPARVYMGEVGGSLIGLAYFVQSSICFSQLKTQMSPKHAFGLILIAGCFPICELGISFIRRILSKKTPFRGDKLHLHYVIKNKYKLSASKTSTLMGLGSMSILSFGFIVANYFNPVFALIVVIIITLQIYLWLCLDEWRSNLTNKEIENVFKLFEGKTVNIIDSAQFSTMDVSLNEKTASDKKKSA